MGAFKLTLDPLGKYIHALDASGADEDEQHVRASLPTLSSTLDRGLVSWDGAFESLSQKMCDTMPSKALMANRAILKDEALYTTFVGCIEKVHNDSLYKEANSLLALVKTFEDQCGPLPSKMIGLMHLRRDRKAARMAIALEWAVTKIRTFPPKEVDIPAHGKAIETKLTQKGLKLTDLPSYVKGMLDIMAKHVPSPAAAAPSPASSTEGTPGTAAAVADPAVAT